MYRKNLSTQAKETFVLLTYRAFPFERYFFLLYSLFYIVSFGTLILQITQFYTPIVNFINSINNSIPGGHPCKVKSLHKEANSSVYIYQILFLNYRKFEIFNLDGCKEAKISVLYRIICSLQNE